MERCNPPLPLDGSNYSYWKVRTRNYIKSIDLRAWDIVLKGFEHPIKSMDSTNGDVILKPETEWTTDESARASFNSRVLAILFDLVDHKVINLIKDCETAKEAWDILERQYEYTVKEAKLGQLMSRFLSLRMTDDDTISSYFEKLREISYQFMILGNALAEKHLVFKAVNTLTPKYYTTKGFDIEKAYNLDFHRLQRMLTEVDRKKSQPGSSSQPQSKMKRASSDYDKYDPKGIEEIQCHACSGWGHYANECATTMRKLGMKMKTSIE